jgi:hypothetical protein
MAGQLERHPEIAVSGRCPLWMYSIIILSDLLYQYLSLISIQECFLRISVAVTKFTSVHKLSLANSAGYSRIFLPGIMAVKRAYLTLSCQICATMAFNGYENMFKGISLIYGDQSTSKSYHYSCQHWFSARIAFFS